MRLLLARVSIHPNGDEYVPDHLAASASYSLRPLSFFEDRLSLYFLVASRQATFQVIAVFRSRVQKLVNLCVSKKGCRQLLSTMPEASQFLL